MFDPNDDRSSAEMDSLLQRIKENLLRLRSTPARTITVHEEATDRTRETIRHLSRSRISQVLRQLRAARGLSYESVHAQTGLSKQLLYDVEYKEWRLTLDELRTLAHCYEVSLGDVLGIEIE